MKRPSIKDRELAATDEMLVGKPVNPQGDKTTSPQRPKATRQLAASAPEEKPQKRSFYLHTNSIEALMGEQLRRLKQGATPGDVSFSALVEEAILQKYGA